MALIRFLLITILLVWLLKELFRFIIPRILKKYIDKINNNQFQQPKKEGETTIISTPPKDDNKLKDTGEYVDYEEIDE